MKQSIRFFAIGLFTSALLLFGYHLIYNASGNLDKIPTDELVAHIETDGLRVISEEDFIAFSLSEKDKVDTAEKTDKNSSTAKKDDTKKENTSKKPDQKKDKEDDKDSDTTKKKDKVKKYTLVTESGVVSEDIANTLADNGIVKDAEKFRQYLEDNDYSPRIQIGSFKLSSDMKHKEIAEIITTYPGSN